MQNKMHKHRSDANYVLNESDMAKNAKQELQGFSCQEEKAPFLIRKCQNHSSYVVNGWYETEFTCQKGLTPKSQYSNNYRDCAQQYQGRRCQTHHHEYMTFRECERMMTISTKNKLRKKLHKKVIDLKQKPQLTLQNLSPAFDCENFRNQTSNKNRNKSGILNKSFMANRRNQSQEKQKLEKPEETQPEQRNQIKIATPHKTHLKHFTFKSSKADSENQEQFSVRKSHKPKKYLKAHYPSYFDFKETNTEFYMDELINKLSPKFCSLNNYMEESASSIYQIKEEFIQRVRNYKKKRSSTQNSEREYFEQEKITEAGKKGEPRKLLGANNLKYFKNRNKEKCIAGKQIFRISQQK